MGFSKNASLIRKIQDGWDPPFWKSTWRHFFCRRLSDLHKISQTGAEWHADCGDMVKIETRCRIPIWRTFGRIQLHVIPDPRITLQGAATLVNSLSWFHSHMPHCRVQSPGEMNVMIVPHCNVILSAIANRFSPYFISVLFFKMQFGLWQAAAFVSSPIHLFSTLYWRICVGLLAACVSLYSRMNGNVINQAGKT